MSGHRWSAMKFQNVWDILLMILGPCFYIFIMEKLPKLKKIQLPKSHMLFSIFFKHPTLGSPPGPCRGRSMKKMHFLGSSDTILSIFVPLFA